MDAYGYNALSGFFGSSSRKQKRKDDIAYLTQIYNLQQQQQQAELVNQQNSQKIIDDAFALAQELTTGKNARKKDLDAIRQMSDNLLAPINDKIRQAGGYVKAKRLGIDQDLRDYQYSLVNNDKVFGMKKTQEAIAKIIEAQAGEDKGQLVPLSVQQKFAAWRNEEIDSFTWDGIKDSPIDMSIEEEYTVEQSIDYSDILYANLSSLQTDYARHVMYTDPDNAEQLINAAYANPGLLITNGYLQQRMGQQQISKPDFGTKKIETTLGQELEEIQGGMFPDGGVAGAEIFAAGSFANYIDSIGWGDRIDSTIGLDETNKNLIEKDGFILDSAGEIGVSGQVNLKILQANYSDRLYEKRGKLYVKSQEGGAEGMYNEKGGLISDASWMDATTDDMEVRGVFLGSKCTYFNNSTGKEESFLLTKAVKDINPFSVAKDLNEKIKGEYSDVKFTPAYVVQFEEPDLLVSDVYYDEVIIADAELAELNKDKDLNKAMGDGRNTRAILQNQKMQEERRAEIEINTLTALDNIYAGGSEGGFKTIANTYELPFRSVMSTSSIPNRMLPYLMADMFEEATIESQTTGNQNTQQIINNYLSNFSILAQEQPEYYKALQDGNVKAFLDYQKESYGKGYTAMRKKYKLWSKYFNNQ